MHVVLLCLAMLAQNALVRCALTRALPAAANCDHEQCQQLAVCFGIWHVHHLPLSSANSPLWGLLQFHLWVRHCPYL